MDISFCAGFLWLFPGDLWDALWSGPEEQDWAPSLGILISPILLCICVEFVLVNSNFYKTSSWFVFVFYFTPLPFASAVDSVNTQGTLCRVC